MRTLLLSIIAIAVTTAAAASAQADVVYTNKALDLVMTGAKCPAKVRAFIPLAKAAEAASEADQAADLYLAIASCYGDMGQRQAGARALAKAVSLGSDDCLFLASDAGLKTLPNHSAMMSRMKMSPADLHELGWLTREIAAVQHETSMMITGNMNRKDGDFTKSFAPTLPTRTQNSSAVRIYRWALVYVFNYQRTIVRQSDNARIKHLVSMNIIGNMGTGSNYYAKQRQITRSRQIANLAATQRQRASKLRAFRAKRSSTRKVSCNRL